MRIFPTADDCEYRDQLSCSDKHRLGSTLLFPGCCRTLYFLQIGKGLEIKRVKDHWGGDDVLRGAGAKTFYAVYLQHEGLQHF